MGATTEGGETRRQIRAALRIVPDFFEGIPEADLVAEWPTFERYTLGETEIPAKYRELMGLAVAANTKCPYCQHFHSHAARLHGATDAEVEEVVALSSMTARWSAMLHAQGYDVDYFEDEVEQVGEHLRSQMESAGD